MKNYVSLIGNVGQAPAIKIIGEKKVCKFSLATSESYKKDGQKIVNTTWHNLILWSPLAEIAEKYVQKGSQIAVDGKIVYRTYDDKDGRNNNITEIVCNNLILLGSKKEGNSETKPEPKADDWQGKKEVKSMSDPNDLPQHVKDAETASDNMDDLPY